MADQPPEDPDKKATQMQQIMEASSLGFMFPLAIGIGFAWGYWMDRMFGTKPVLTWVFTAFGIVAAFINLFRFAMKK